MAQEVPKEGNKGNSTTISKATPAKAQQNKTKNSSKRKNKATGPTTPQNQQRHPKTNTDSSNTPGGKGNNPNSTPKPGQQKKLRNKTAFGVPRPLIRKTRGDFQPIRAPPPRQNFNLLYQLQRILNNIIENEVIPSSPNRPHHSMPNQTETILHFLFVAASLKQSKR
jgi:hypothetical protein